jgi:hypothetical protein
MESISFAGTTYQFPNRAGENGWATALTSYLRAIGTYAQTTSNQRVGTRVATTTPVTVASSDYAVIVKLTAPGAVAVTLPAGATGRTFVITDGTGDAYTNNITITPDGTDKIQGASSYVMNENYGSVTLIWDAAASSPSWRIASSFAGDNPVVASLRATAGTASTSTTTGTIIVTGGVGVSGAIYAGSLQATPVGSTTAASGAFTTLTSTGASTLGSASNAVVTIGHSASTAAHLAYGRSLTFTGDTGGDAVLALVSASTNNAILTVNGPDNAGAASSLYFKSASSVRWRIQSGQSYTGYAGQTADALLFVNDPNSAPVASLEPGAIGKLRLYSNAGANNEYLELSKTASGGVSVIDSNKTSGGTARSIEIRVAGTAAVTVNASATASTSTTTGAAVVTGGLGVSGAIYAGSLQNTPVGSTTASSGAFTTLTSTGASTFGSAGNAVVTIGHTGSTAAQLMYGNSFTMAGAGAGGGTAVDLDFIINTGATTRSPAFRAHNGTHQSRIGLQGSTSGLITGATTGGLCIRSDGVGIWFSGDSGGTTHGSCSTAGEWTFPLQPAFMMQKTGSQTIEVGSENVDWTGTEVYDQGSDFDGTSTFTAPVTGIYEFCGCVFISSQTTVLNDTMELILRVNSVDVLTIARHVVQVGVAATNYNMNFTTRWKVTAGHTVVIKMSNGGTNTATIGGGADRTWFSGQLVA